MWSKQLALTLALPFATASPALRSLQTRDSASPQSCTQACSTLETQFPGRLHYKANDSNFVIWDQKQLQTAYVCRVQPSSSEEVSSVLKVLLENWCRFSVKGGGHSRSVDDAVSNGGVTIDLNLLNGTTIADDKASARILGGTLTRDAYTDLDKEGLAYVGGRLGQIGIGGFLLGGGTSVSSSKYGWGLDNVLEYEVVLPNATITTVTETSNPDMFFALRGGGNNFGIVTAFTVNTFPLGQVYVGSRTFSDAALDAYFVEAENIFTLQDGADTNIVMESRYLYDKASNSYTMGNTQRYLEPVMSPPVFDTLNAIPGTIGNLTGGLNTLAASVAFSRPLGVSRNSFTTLANYPSPALWKKATEIFKELYGGLPNTTTINPNLITYSIPAGAIEKMKTKGGNALGIDVDGHLVMNLFSVTWTDAAEDETAANLAETYYKLWKQAAIDLEVFHPFVYLNYADTPQDPFTSYGEENKQRLMSIQQAIDPQGAFRSSGLWTGYRKLL
ncbi:hypothetical protein HYALB_00011087 [Hymenoscyphus albidus]|uniref:FAD-binding PCMH-type domain-containing protein n=1 Tax=Hymenoscyphus albidus TaxID=595503 RepID=A0A9N9LUF9_9HELO|nr:hypothetical protein HYALB_00011087 [Hymenoscyphus albidus]